MRNNNVNASPKDVALLMNRYDQNRDGKVTFLDVSFGIHNAVLYSL